MKNKLREPHATDNKNKHHSKKKATRNRIRGFETMKRNEIQANVALSLFFHTTRKATRKRFRSFERVKE